jgi:hypothetical protein
MTGTDRPGKSLNIVLSALKIDSACVEATHLDKEQTDIQVDWVEYQEG